MIMAGTWVIFVKITMQVPQRPMVGAVLGVAVKALFMGAAVSFIDLPVEAQVSPVIPSVPAVIVVVGKRRAKRSGYDDDYGRHARDHRAHLSFHREVNEAHRRAHEDGFYSQAEHRAYHRALRDLHGDFHEDHPGTRHDHYRRWW